MQIEEDHAILKADIVITLSQRSLDLTGLQVFDRVLAPQEIVAVAEQLRDDATHVAQNKHLRPRDIAGLYAVDVAVAHPNRTSACEACAAGFYKDVAGSAPCDGCGLGKFFNGPVPGIFESESCFYCLEGSYQDTPGQVACKACSQNSSSAAGAIHESMCMCKPAYGKADIFAVDWLFAGDSDGAACEQVCNATMDTICHDPAFPDAYVKNLLPIPTPVIALDDAFFDLATLDYVRFEPAFWDMHRHHGFTVVTKVRWSHVGDDPLLPAAPTFIERATYRQTVLAVDFTDFVLHMGRDAAERTLFFSINGSGFECGVHGAQMPWKNDDNNILARTWWTLVWQHNTQQNLTVINITADPVFADIAMASTDLTHTYNMSCVLPLFGPLRASEAVVGNGLGSHKNQPLYGDVAGLYVWDRLLPPSQVQEIVAGIRIDDAFLPAITDTSVDPDPACDAQRPWNCFPSTPRPSAGLSGRRRASLPGNDQVPAVVYGYYHTGKLCAGGFDLNLEGVFGTLVETTTTTGWCTTLQELGAKIWYLSPPSQPDYFESANSNPIQLESTTSFLFSSNGGFTIILKFDDHGSRRNAIFYELHVDNFCEMWLIQETFLSKLMFSVRNLETGSSCDLEIDYSGFDVIKMSITFNYISGELKAAYDVIDYEYNELGTVLQESARDSRLVVQQCHVDAQIPDIALSEKSSSAITHKIGG